MRGYLGTCREAWTNEEFWFPYGVNVRYGTEKKTRLQVVCEEMWSSNNPDNIYWSWLVYAYDPVKRVKRLLELGADPNLADTRGFTPLHISARNAWEDHIPIIRALIKGGANVNALTKIGHTPLFMAAYNNSVDIAKILIENGASVNNFDDYRLTPLHAATMRSDVNMMKLLILHGALMTSETLKDAIEEGCANPVNKIKYLYSIDCPKIDSPVYEAVAWNHPELVRTLIKLGESPEVANGHFSPLEWALMQSRVECLNELCKGGADVNIIRDGMVQTPLHRAIIHSNFDCIITLCRWGADTSVRDTLGDTALHSLICQLTIYHRAVSIDKFKQFLKYVTDFKATNAKNQTPFQYAMKSNLKDFACEIKREEMRRTLTKGRAK